jgi:hypothetical protein
MHEQTRPTCSLIVECRRQKSLSKTILVVARLVRFLFNSQTPGRWRSHRQTRSIGPTVTTQSVFEVSERKTQVKLQTPAKEIMMMRDVAHGRGRSLGQLETVDEPVKEDWRGRQASKEIAIPSDVAIKGHDDHEGKILDIFAHRTLATLTETFTSTSDDDMAFVGSFELHGLDVQKKYSVSKEDPPVPAVAPHLRDRWPNNFYRRDRYEPPVRRPVAPSLFSSSSNDSWDEQNGDARQVSLLDMVESRDDEEDEGHDGDDERDTSVEMDKMRRITMQFQQSHDSLSPVNQSFQESLPKFSQGPLSHLRDGQKTPFEDMTQTFQTSYKSSSSFASPRKRSQRAYLHSVEKVEEEKKTETSITEKKGLFESIKDLVSCVAESGGN